MRDVEDLMRAAQQLGLLETVAVSDKKPSPWSKTLDPSLSVAEQYRERMREFEELSVDSNESHLASQDLDRLWYAMTSSEQDEYDAELKQSGP